MIVGVLLSVVLGTAQVSENTVGTDSHVIEGRMDVFGLTVMPLQAAFSEGLDARSRIHLGAKYMYNDMFGFSYTLGKDRRDRGVVRRTFEEYEFSAVYHQINISGYVNPHGRFNPGAGIGLMYDLKHKTEDEDMFVETVPSAGPSLLTSRRDATGIGFALYFSYRLYGKRSQSE